jgi:diguanylate cyclase (GGDEF)-like protein
MEVRRFRRQTAQADMTEIARTDRARGVAAPGVPESLRETLARTAMTLRDGGVPESAALLLPIVLVGATHAEGPALWLIAIAYLVAGAMIAVEMPAHRSRASRAMGWTAARVLLSVAMVAAGQVLTGSTGLLSVTYLPIIALSAFAGPRLLTLAVGASIGAHFTAELFDRGLLIEALERVAGFIGAAVLVAYGTHREVERMQRARRRLRLAVRVDRRRARQIAGVEAIGRILAGRGPVPEALDEVVGRIAGQFGYRYVSLYLGDDRLVRLGAQRGYVELVESFGGDRGIVGRVMRTRRPVFVADIARDPDYWGLNPDVSSEICVPLLAEEEFLGFVNVEATTIPLDGTDLRIMITIADRLAAALIIGRERQRLAERADLFRALHGFSEAVNGTLQPEELYRAIVRSVSTVVAADVAALHVIDRDSGRHLLAAVEGGDLATLNADARPGEGMAGRAIRERSMIVDDVAPQPLALRSVGHDYAADGPQAPMLAASVPIVRDGAVLGALTLTRADRDRRFTDLERDVLSMLAEQSALALTNVLLHAEVNELAMRDPLTGLFNRRYLDPALEQLFARRSRMAVDERVPLAAVMFDLDHFSDLNNRHGHQIGDEVLRAFGAILRARMRTTDLVARFGGEEFAAVLFRATLDDAIRIADEVRQQLAETPIMGVSGEELSATVSAGCAALAPEQESSDDLLRAADVALYMAKRAGRDRVCAA